MAAPPRLRRHRSRSRQRARRLRELMQSARRSFGITRLAIILSVVALTALPATAQDGVAGGNSIGADDGKVNLTIVYGDDPCPESDSGEIIVCARKPEEERYRIPEVLRDVDRPQSEAWTSKVLAYETVGRSGPMSCSPVGFFGATGCFQQFMDRYRAERANSSEARYERLIEAERQKRLARIDAEAVAEQARVDEMEEEHSEAPEPAAAAQAPDAPNE